MSFKERESAFAHETLGIQYASVPSEDGTDEEHTEKGVYRGDIDEEKAQLINSSMSQNTEETPRIRLVHLLAFSILLFGLSVSFFIYNFNLATTDAACAKRFWSNTPMLEGTHYDWTQYDSDIIEDKYYGVPTDEKRHFWMDLYDHGSVGFPADQVPVVNKTWDNKNWWRLQAPMSDQILGFPERTHQMHCISFFWMYGYRKEWDYQTTYGYIPAVFSLHIQHCALIIFNMITCQADVSPVLFQEDATEIGAWKTSDVPKKCKNLEKLARWQQENAICVTDCFYGQVHMPGGSDPLPLPATG